MPSAATYTKVPHPTWASQLQEENGDSVFPPHVCAKFVTMGRGGRKDIILLSVDKPVTIGRNTETCTYVLPEIVVSGTHCKLYAVPSSNEGIIVSCQDLSTNGIILNGHKIRRASVLVMDGDVIQIPGSQSFTCIHARKELREKTNPFDPTPPQQPAYKKIGPYTVTSHSLGKGGFATVYLAMDTIKYRQVACKTYKTKNKKELGNIVKECNILSELHHPVINQVLHAQVDGKFLHIFLELCTGGDLFTYIVSHEETEHRLVEGEAKYIMYQLFKGLKYLHDRHISHRDLKPENILLSTPGPYPHIQIADFGLARPKAYEETRNVCGTVSYLPPEGILALDNRNLGYVGMPSDCWSAGVIMYMLLSGGHPFDHGPVEALSQWFPKGDEEDLDPNSQLSQVSVKSQTEIAIKQRIIGGQLEFDPWIWDDIPDARTLCARMLIYNHLDRCDVYSALHSRWLRLDLEELEAAYQERVASSRQSSTGIPPC